MGTSNGAPSPQIDSHIGHRDPVQNQTEQVFPYGAKRYSRSRSVPVSTYFCGIFSSGCVRSDSSDAGVADLMGPASFECLDGWRPPVCKYIDQGGWC